MFGWWMCDLCGANTLEPKSYRFCGQCDKEVKSLRWKLGQARGALKRLKKIAYPRPAATDIIDKVLKKL